MEIIIIMIHLNNGNNKSISVIIVITLRVIYHTKNKYIIIISREAITKVYNNHYIDPVPSSSATTTSDNTDIKPPKNTTPKYTIRGTGKLRNFVHSLQPEMGKIIFAQSFYHIIPLLCTV